MSAEDGSGLVSLRRPPGRVERTGSHAPGPVTSGSGTPISYHLENWLTIGGFKTVQGWLEGDRSFLCSLVPAAEVYLFVKSGRAMRIEVTDVTANRGNFRLPRFPHSN